MTSRNRGSSVGRRIKREPINAADTVVKKLLNDFSAYSLSESDSKPASAARNTDKHTQDNTVSTSNQKPSSDSTNHTSSSQGAPSETAFLSEVAIRYSLTPSTNEAQPELDGVQVNIEPDPLGVDSRRENMADHENKMALVPATCPTMTSQMDDSLLKPLSRECYSSSEDSTNASPRSAGGQAHKMSIVRTGCNSDSSDAASSIAVDCHTRPSEVIVRGKNVSKIHVKFPPHPPFNAGDDLKMPSFSSFEQISLKTSGRFRRQTHLQRSTGAQAQEHGDDSLRASDENPIRTAPHRPNTITTAPVLPEITGVRTGHMHEQPSPGLRDSGVSNISYDMYLSNANEWEQKIKHDIINGIEYFERKNAEMRYLNNSLATELERIRRLNQQLDDRLKMASERNTELSEDNSELKVRLDSRERENAQLKDDAMKQWHARVKAEELYMELKRDTDVEIHRLKEQLSNKEKEIARVISSAAQKEKSLRNSIREPGIANKSLRANMEDHLELLHKISRLEEEISTLKDDNEKEKVTSKKSKDEVESVKAKLKEHMTELESQHKRFLSLKKNFNDVRDENEKLKCQIRSRRSNANPNNTWPKNTMDSVKSGSENEAVSYFDIPSKVSKSNSPAGKKLTKPFELEHKRTTSDGKSTFSDNLPPVLNTQK